MAPRACVRVYARLLVLVPPNLYTYIHTYLYLLQWSHLEWTVAEEVPGDERDERAPGSSASNELRMLGAAATHSKQPLKSLRYFVTQGLLPFVSVAVLGCGFSLYPCVAL